MWNPIQEGGMPRYWPPRPSRFWQAVLEPFRRAYLRRCYLVPKVETEGLDRLRGILDKRDGVMITPNHSHDSDPHVIMDVLRPTRAKAHFMAAWQIFSGHAGWDGWILQRLGAFSVDREGCDRRAIQQAIQLLRERKTLVVFPEGDVYRLNERLTPLLDGAAFMAVSAQRGLSKDDEHARIWIVPTAIRYRYLDDISRPLQEALARLEKRMLWNMPTELPIAERVIRFGELLLTIKEKEQLGRAQDHDGDLPARIRSLTEFLLRKLEHDLSQRSPSAETVPLRVKAVRRIVLDRWMDDTQPADTRKQARESLDRIHLAIQLYSYPGNYVGERASWERLAETVDKFEEDIEGIARCKGRRHAKVIFGEPIDVRAAATDDRPRAVAASITDRVEKEVQQLMDHAFPEP